MKALVFLGPTMAIAEARSYVDAEFLPPASQGDVYRVARTRPHVIGIIDGYFEHVPSVWHKEILWAMSQGIHVFGAASMGALRAAELADFGMEGIGQVFEWFRDGVLEDDDEVAIVHGPAESGYIALSEALVNVRATVAAAITRGIVSADLGSTIIATAKGLHYSERNYASVLTRVQADGAHDPELDVFRHWLATGRVDQKRLDAADLLTTVARRMVAAPGAKRVEFHFERTVFWERLERVTGVDTVGRVTLRAIRDELRLDPLAYARAHDGALLRDLALSEARREGVETGEEASDQDTDSFCSRHNLVDAVDKARWREANRCSESEWVALLRDENVLQSARRAFHLRGLRRLVDHLRATGQLAQLHGRASRKEALLAGQGTPAPTPDQVGMTPENLVGWYLNQLRQPADGVAIGEYGAALQAVCEDVPGLIRAAARELRYRQLSDPESDPTAVSDLFPYPAGIHFLPTPFVASYADPAIDPGHPAQRARMERLRASIERDGVQDPLTIKVEPGGAHLFDGNHRVAIARMLGIPVVPVLVKYEL